MSAFPEYIQLNSRYSSLVISLIGRAPMISYWGKTLANNESGSQINSLSFRQEAKCSAVDEPDLSLTPNLGQGFTGAPGVELWGKHGAWSFCGEIQQVEQPDNQTVHIISEDSIRNIRIIHKLHLTDETGVLSADTELVNLGDNKLNVTWCSAPNVPLAPDYTEILTFEGRWAKEFQMRSIPRTLGGYVRENRKGHTSHDSFPGFVVHKSTADELQGECYGFHLGWSGNHRTRVETLPDGRGYAQLGELLLPGEVVLSKGESYVSPKVFASYSANGFSNLSNQFHQYVRHSLLSEQVNNTPRPIHYNTWEGIYFDHDTKTLIELATKAASLGAERFVLDDGWFIGRRNDKAGLGDWFVDTSIYPEGLSPLISHVNELGMEFGLWFEPEMVNPDSDLFRAHPDWVLSSQNNPQLNFRNQLVLDLTRPEVTDYLYKCIHDILVEYPKIAYLKWDMNRDLNHAGGQIGQPAVHKQTLALYQLIAKLKQAHPKVEIESCSSGGGRIDYGILRHTDRVWTSDSNDALDRLSIQRGASFFIPAEIMGAHVGPQDCHITGRRVSMAMRAAVSMFGHMGIEMDPRTLDESESEELRNALALHKHHRQLIHSGRLLRLPEDNEGNSVRFAIIDELANKALFSYNLVTESNRYLPDTFKFTGLDTDKRYKLDLVWPTQLDEYSDSVLTQVNGQIFSGELLVNLGMQLPVIDPQSALIFELTAV